MTDGKRDVVEREKAQGSNWEKAERTGGSYERTWE